MPNWIVYYVLSCVGSMVLALVLGRIKNRDGQQWAFASFLFPPAVLLLLVMPRLVGPRPKRPGWDEDHNRTLQRDDRD